MEINIKGNPDTEKTIQRALLWYCRDCAFNDRCNKEYRCAFYSFFKKYLEGDDTALPPKEERNPRDRFNRFHRQLVDNLNEYVNDYEKKTQNREDDKAHQGYISGMRVIIGKLKDEINHLNRED